MNSTNKLLSLNNISKTYHSIHGETKALDNISFDLCKNEFIGIIGPSGCGKSSILNIISSLETEYSGNISIKDDNVILGLKISKKLNDNTKDFTINLLIKYGLYSFKDKYPNELSGGMKQRLALIRTLACNPDILLLDESIIWRNEAKGSFN